MKRYYHRCLTFHGRVFYHTIYKKWVISYWEPYVNSYQRFQMIGEDRIINTGGTK
jgi:hypothetical protein